MCNVEQNYISNAELMQQAHMSASQQDINKLQMVLTPIQHRMRAETRNTRVFIKVEVKNILLTRRHFPDYLMQLGKQEPKANLGDAILGHTHNNKLKTFAASVQQLQILQSFGGK